jgi:hypothetical protein
VGLLERRFCPQDCRACRLSRKLPLLNGIALQLVVKRREKVVLALTSNSYMLCAAGDSPDSGH